MTWLKAVIAFIRARSFRQLTVAGIALSFLVGALIIWLTVARPMQNILDRDGIDTAARDYQQQDDSRIGSTVTHERTAPRPRQAAKQLYWGDLHIHTQESFDSRLFGNPFGIEDAYRFAKGEPLTTPGGEVMQLSRPLDFVAITDHAEGFGTRTHCDDPNLSLGERGACWLAHEPNPMIFQILVGNARGKAMPGDPSMPAGVYQQTSRTPSARGPFPPAGLEMRPMSAVSKTSARIGLAMWIWLTSIMSRAR